jgi:hypothetical protein
MNLLSSLCKEKGGDIMDYSIKRAIHTKYGVFNIGDTILIYLEGSRPIKTELVDIFWADEYNAYIVTTEGKFLLKDILKCLRLVTYQESII